MSYHTVNNRRIADLFSEEPLIRTARRIVDRCADRLLALTRELTPVADPDGAPTGEWLLARGREPGSLRRSWERTTVIGDAEGFRAEVLTRDPVAPFVEYPTSPHVIRPRKPDGWLRFWVNGRLVFAKVVHHPGTRGSFMLHRAAAELRGEFAGIAREELARWKREQTRAAA